MPHHRYFTSAPGNPLKAPAADPRSYTRYIGVFASSISHLRTRARLPRTVARSRKFTTKYRCCFDAACSGADFHCRLASPTADLKCPASPWSCVRNVALTCRGQALQGYSLHRTLPGLRRVHHLPCRTRLPPLVMAAWSRRTAPALRSIERPYYLGSGSGRRRAERLSLRNDATRFSRFVRGFRHHNRRRRRGRSYCTHH